MNEAKVFGIFPTPVYWCKLERPFNLKEQKYFTNINRIRIPIYIGMLVEYQKLALKNETTKNSKKNTKNLTM